MAMSIGREVLKIIDEEQLQENCREMGKRFMEGLRDIQSRNDAIGEVRGAGLLIGVEIVKDFNHPDPKFFDRVHEKARDYGILLGKGGRHGNVFKIQPPMCINSHDVDFALDVIEKSLNESM